jgi:hypothetical protein
VRKDLVTQPEDWFYSDCINWIKKENGIIDLKIKNETLSISSNQYKQYLDSSFNFISAIDLKQLTQLS